MMDERKPNARLTGDTPDEEDLLGPDLRALLGSLPRELAPERDLMASIVARTRDRLERARQIDPTRGERKWWYGQRLKLAVAAVALIIATSVVTMAVLKRDAQMNDAGATIATATEQSRALMVAADYTDVENQYASAIADLATTLEAERDRLPPETVRLIEDNLRVIDNAIQQSLAALEAAPQSLPLQQAVTTSYERKLDFLRQAAAITAEG